MMELLQWMNAGSSPDGSVGFVGAFEVVVVVAVVVVVTVVVAAVVVVTVVVVVVEVVVGGGGPANHLIKLCIL